MKYEFSVYLSKHEVELLPFITIADTGNVLMIMTGWLTLNIELDIIKSY